MQRPGGEEFVGILPDTSAYIAQGIAQRLCGLVRNLHIAAAPKQITDSIGLSAIDPNRLRGGSDPHFEHLLREAKKTLYATKSKGRNRVSYLSTQATYHSTKYLANSCKSDICLMAGSN